MKRPVKRRALFQKCMLEKWTKILFIEKIISHKAKYYVKYLKGNEVKSSDTKGL